MTDLRSAFRRGALRPADSLCCKHCGGNAGYYRKATYTGKGIFNYAFDGEFVDAEGLHDSAEYKEQRTMYCLECDKKLGVVPAA